MTVIANELTNTTGKKIYFSFVLLVKDFTYKRSPLEQSLPMESILVNLRYYEFTGKSEKLSGWG